MCYHTSVHKTSQSSAVEWPNSSKLAQLLCHVEKKFAKHIGPEEFVQCSQNLIKEEQQQSNYDVPPSSSLSTVATSIITNSFATNPMTASALVQQQLLQDVQSKKKTCNLENYFEWSSRLRLLVANEILQVSLCYWFLASHNSHRKTFPSSSHIFFFSAY